jgi:hypothetical protein
VLTIGKGLRTRFNGIHQNKLSIEEGDNPLFVPGTGLGTGDNEYWIPNDSE